MLVGAHAGERLDASRVRGYRALGNEDQRPDLPGRRDVGTPAELGRIVADLHHPHAFAVLVAEERERAHLLGLLLRGLEGLHTGVFDDPRVDGLLDVEQLFGGGGVEVAEVEAKTVGGHERAGLVHVVAEDLAQAPVQDVGTGVVLADVLSPDLVDVEPDLLTGLHVSLLDAPAMTVDAGQRILGVEHPDRARLAGDQAAIADLAARLRVERRAVQENLHVLATLGVLDDVAFAHDGQHAPGCRARRRIPRTRWYRLHAAERGTPRPVPPLCRLCSDGGPVRAVPPSCDGTLRDRAGCRARRGSPR